MLIGIDAGGSSTRAVVLDETGFCLGFGVGGGGNPTALGPMRAGEGIRTAIFAALQQARQRGDLGMSGGTAVLAMAGGSTAGAPDVETAVRQVAGVDRVVVASDLLAMFAAGVPEESGYVLVSGTGAAALRVENNTVAQAVDGLGWLLGDDGSGFWLGHRAVRAALAAISGHGPPTSVADLLRDELGRDGEGYYLLRDRNAFLAAAVEKFYQVKPVELAAYAALVFRAAKVADPGDVAEPVPRGFPRDADPVAVEILTDAVALLTRTLAAVRTPALAGPVVIGGSIARRLPGLVESVREPFEADGYPVPPVTIAVDGVIGAAVLALRQVGVTVDRTVFDRIASTLAPLRNTVVA